MSDKKDNENTKSNTPEDIDYLIQCNLMTPEERINKGFELSEWAMLINKHIDSEIKKRLLNAYCLL